MKQRSQINIIHNNKQLHYMVEFHDAGVIDVTHGEYSYYSKAAEGVQFIRNTKLINNFENNDIYNVVRNTNTWTPETRTFSNLYIPKDISQRQVTLYIPRYSIESFYERTFGEDHELSLSGIKYILTAFIYIAGVKVVLGSYLFDLGSARATHGKTRYKGMDYQLCVDFNIVDPVTLTYNDEWAWFRQIVCGEPSHINNTGSVVHINLDPVTYSDSEDFYICSNEFTGGITGIPFEKDFANYFHADLSFDGNAKIKIAFNKVYFKDIDLYLAETYNTWHNDGTELTPRKHCAIFEVVIRDKENIYTYATKTVNSLNDLNDLTFVFDKSEIAHPWSWYKDGLFIQGNVEIYDADEVMEAVGQISNDEECIENIRSMVYPVADLITNEIALNKENYKYLVPITMLATGKDKINLKLVKMNEYEVNVVNKIHKKVINVNRPEDYKSNIIKPVFIHAEKLGNVTIHPAVSENISINLNKYKSKVDLFYLRIEGVDFIEIGRTPQSVIFTIDGNLLPNEVTEGVMYVLDENFSLVTTGHYTYEQ